MSAAAPRTGARQQQTRPKPLGPLRICQQSAGSGRSPSLPPRPRQPSRALRHRRRQRRHLPQRLRRPQRRQRSTGTRGTHRSRRWSTAVAGRDPAVPRCRPTPPLRSPPPPQRPKTAPKTPPAARAAAAAAAATAAASATPSHAAGGLPVAEAGSASCSSASIMAAATAAASVEVVTHAASTQQCVQPERVSPDCEAGMLQVRPADELRENTLALDASEWPELSQAKDPSRRPAKMKR
mmetsp:Transcript_109591/g.274547  ORF Transcript_109591/g.274547 Transcript_109591/m.274547 type:complete len:238 (+) Transcript_109591:661-1374(+)